MRGLALGLVVLVMGAQSQEDQVVDGVFPQMGTGAKELQDETLVKILEEALQAADKSKLDRRGTCMFKQFALGGVLIPCVWLARRL